MISFKQKGNFKKVDSFFEKCLEPFDLGVLNKYGKRGVDALSFATPIDTGLAANSWYYDIVRYDGGVKIVWSNSDIEGGYNVAILLQYGHATKDGTRVEGIDYINPALRPIFEEIKDEILKGV